MQIAFISLIFLTILNISIIDGNGPENVIKCPNSVEVEFWLTIIGLGNGSDNQLGQQFACDLSVQQQLLKALYESRIGNFNSDALKGSSAFSKRYFELKNQMEFIRNNDPEMAKVLEELISVEIEAKEALQNKDTNTDAMLISLKDKLVNAVHFIAKRQQISATENAPLKGIDMQELLKELMVLSMDFENRKQRNKNGKDGYSKGSEKCDDDHYSREKRMLQLVMTSIGGGNGMPPNPTTGRRRRRRSLNNMETLLIAIAIILWICGVAYCAFCREPTPWPNRGGDTANRQADAERNRSSESHTVDMGH